MEIAEEDGGQGTSDTQDDEHQEQETKEVKICLQYQTTHGLNCAIPPDYAKMNCIFQ